ncbi:hypothetical protein G7Y82_09775 [Solimonas sp. C16B3]|uniref:SnoaL-like domain-containing protein n=1 Tax=Solimonas marina TaxID=2714601 RepID=A0A969WAT9_9GAMM|nr:hypothetical protein [Solimonas marina]
MAVPLAAQAATAPAGSDEVSQMFKWWNGAFKVKGSFTPDAFRQYFTDDATLTLDGRVAIRGVGEWAEHFQKIQANVDEVEIVLPFMEEFQSGNKIYTYHIIRARDHGKPSCEIAAGHAILRGGKIASLALVRTDLTPEQADKMPGCWHS